MIVLDTHALIRAAIEPHKLPARVRRALEEEPEAAACDISLWEIAMLIARRSVRPIAATAIVHNSTLITADAQLRKIRGLNTLWK